MRTSPERDRKLSTTAREEPDINQRVLTLTVPIKKLTYLLYLFGPTRGVTAKYLVLRTRKLASSRIISQRMFTTRGIYFNTNKSILPLDVQRVVCPLPTASYSHLHHCHSPTPGNQQSIICLLKKTFHPV